MSRKYLTGISGEAIEIQPKQRRNRRRINRTLDTFEAMEARRAGRLPPDLEEDSYDEDEDV